MKKLALVLTAAVLAGCGKQVEFPKGSLLSVKAKKDVNQYKLGFEEVMEFVEGELGEYVIVASVPEDKPVVTIEGLPATATFSGADWRISWRPPVGSSKETRLGSHFHSYPIRIRLKAETDPDQVLIRTAVMVVFEGTKP